MMKISKPVMTNDFILSPVQFTSLNSILFKNVKNIYEGNEKIVLEYEHSPKIESSSRDWVGIFPRGWSTLQQYITFEWISQSLPCGNNEQNKENGDLIRRNITFCPKYHKESVNSSSFYQFVYVSKQIEVLGVSSYFRFDLKNSNDSPLELECLVPVSHKLRSTSVSDFGLLLSNKISSATSIDNRTLQTTSIHSLQNMDAEGKWTKSPIPLADIKKASGLPRKPAGTGDALDPYSSHSEPVFPMSFQMTQCKKCFHFKRGGEFLRSHQVLQSKVGQHYWKNVFEEASEFGGQRRILGQENGCEEKLKIVMERNKVLEERAIEMRKEMVKLQTESKKLKMSFYSTNKEKVAYEKFVKDFIKSLEKDSIVRVVNGNTEILVKKVNYVGMEEHPRDKKTSKRERELKAVIGLQEITIRNLISSLQEKAKSVQELNQTVKLAQAFSAATEDNKEYNSDGEEVDDVSNSDATSEYEFSLKPPTPEEGTAEDTDAVLEDIRRTTEMKLKDIGISRSLGKSTSRDSSLDIPKLSVHSFGNQSESTQPKKPRLVDNMEDSWSYREDTPKVHRKVMDPCPKMEEVTEHADEPEKTQVLDSDQTNYENYYDACDALNGRETETEETDTQMAIVEEKPEDKKNFLVTAIIPNDLELKSTNEDWKTEERKPEPEKPKKFTCELSIDFATKLPKEQTKTEQEESEGVIDECQKQDKLLTFKKSNKVEIQITREKEKSNNLVHQKMVLKFAKEPQAGNESSKPSKFEFNLALTGLGEGAKVIEAEPETTGVPELKATEDFEMDTSPRTVWNDASEDIEEPFEQEEVEDVRPTTPVEESASSADESKDEVESVSSKSNEDSLRYEKNLEFLQQKTEEKAKEEDTVKDKPSAILIQNGPTKLALIRYQ